MRFRDLQAQYAALKNEIDTAMLKVAADSNFIGGEQVGRLERELAEYVGAKHCITCANGTDALTLVLKAWGIGPQDAVFVPDFTFFASGEVVSFEGAEPIFVDVDEDTFNMSAASLEEAVKKVLEEGRFKPKAIMPVDLFGLPADFLALRKIADKYNLLILEDGAQGFGGSIRKQRACSFGDAAATSFFPAKPLGCYGDGGAVFTNDDGVAQYIHSIKVHGKGTHKYDNVRIGMNSRLDTVQAAILLVKLRAFREYELEAVNRAAQWYEEELKGIIKTPQIPADYGSSWAQYTVTVPSEEMRDGLQTYLKEKDIPSMIYYPKPMHRQEAFKNGKTYVDLKVTEKLCSCVLSLPMHPYLSREEVSLVCGNIREYFTKGDR